MKANHDAESLWRNGGSAMAASGGGVAWWPMT